MSDIEKQFKNTLISFLDVLIGQFPMEGYLVIFRIFLKDMVPIVNILNFIYEADNLKPLVGSVFKGNVCMIFENGFMVNIKDKMKVFVPNYLLTNFKYISGNFVNDKFTIYENTVLNIEIIMIKYEKKEYSCIGKYIL